ncbi:MAG TPA: sialate O-acetylesterase [Verrucomicrobiae bacterium]|nr:sialate O-acetylesterase [Verrucomicrobiae bacterium]
MMNNPNEIAAVTARDSRRKSGPCQPPSSILCLLILLLALVPCLRGFGNDGTNSLPFVSPMFGDNMVLQRGKLNTIWGWSAPGDVVRVEIAGHKARAIAGADGRWEARIKPPPTGGPYELNIDGSQQHVALHNILVGDVWLCGGQSNMELPLSRTRNGAEVISRASDPQIRFFQVHSHAAYSPVPVPEGEWKICSPQTVAEGEGFSAVAYYFGRRIQQDIKVPVGLVEDCLGGTPAETWMNPKTLAGLKEFQPQLAELQRLKARGGPEYGNFVMHWYDDYDIGLKGGTWAAPGLDDSSWKTVQIPGGFRELGVPESPAVCWFRKTVVLPDPLPAGHAAIFLGVIERMDTTYINGQWVGASAWVENPRFYFLKPGVLKPGTNVIAVRVFKTKPDGGFMSPAKSLRLILGDRSTIPLAGDWKGAVSVDARPPHPMPISFENWPVIPGVLYQGMLQPVAPLAISGVIWYQGEANADRAYQYRTLLPGMIADWRELFHQGKFPFYIVSLPAFMHHSDQPAESSWAELREAQALTAANTPHSGLAVTIDTGDPDNIHPMDKEIVGDRLAFCALNQYYGKNIPFQGPTFVSMKRVDGSLKLKFAHTDGGLVAKGGVPEEFSVAGPDRKWHWADAKIEGNAVIVSSPDVPDPVAARYAWQSFPKATLYNGAGLPAVPFRTDAWPESTQPK